MQSILREVSRMNISINDKNALCNAITRLMSVHIAEEKKISIFGNRIMQNLAKKRGMEVTPIYEFNGYGNVIVDRRMKEADYDMLKAEYEEKLAKRKPTKLEKAFSACSFFCKICKEEVEPCDDSSAVRAFRDRELTLEKAKELLLNAHIRHEHTNYDEKIERVKEKAYRNYRNADFSLMREMKEEAIREIRMKARRNTTFK